jgi:hypothetical protein
MGTKELDFECVCVTAEDDRLGDQVENVPWAANPPGFSTGLELVRDCRYAGRVGAGVVCVKKPRELSRPYWEMIQATLSAMFVPVCLPYCFAKLSSVLIGLYLASMK